MLHLRTQITHSRAPLRPIIMSCVGADALLQLACQADFGTTQAVRKQESVRPLVPAACDGDDGAQRNAGALASPPGGARAAGSCSREVMASFW